MQPAGASWSDVCAGVVGHRGTKSVSPVFVGNGVCMYPIIVTTVGLYTRCSCREVIKRSMHWDRCAILADGVEDGRGTTKGLRNKDEESWPRIVATTL